MNVRQSVPARPLRVQGTFPVEFTYTVGVAAQRFFAELRDNGRLVGTKCKTCDLLYMPPRLYCERCFNRLQDWQEIPPIGEVYTFTWKKRPNSAGQFLGLIRFPKVHGGLIHFLKPDKKRRLRIGAKARAVLQPKRRRTGSIGDVKYFEVYD